MSFRVLFCLWGCWVSVVACTVGCTQQDQELTALSELYVEHQRAQQLLKDGQVAAAVHALRRVNQRFPKSRAVLESLLMAEMKGDGTIQQVGYQRIQAYIASHPGDAQLRLVQTKYHLLMGLPSKANADLQILLFNKTFHPWVLAQDTDLQQHKEQLEQSKLPFGLIQPLSATMSPSLIIGDRGEIVVEALHLSDCELTFQTTNLQVALTPKRVTVYTDVVDEVVSKTKLVLQYDAVSAGTQSNLLTNVVCGTEVLTVSMPTFEVFSLNSTKDATGISIKNIEIPGLATLETRGSIPWRIYQNQVLVHQGP